jgi:hypothetical protein
VASQLLITYQTKVLITWFLKGKKGQERARHQAQGLARCQGLRIEVGVDFEEVFTPVVWMESVCTILAVATHVRWHVHYTDVKSAFLNGELEEEVYVSWPPGLTIVKVDQVLALNKALYGFRQAPRAWYAKLHMSLCSLRFVRSDHEHTVYTKWEVCHPLVIGVYVNNLLITRPVDDNINRFKMEKQERFHMSDLGLLTYYLRIEVR